MTYRVGKDGSWTVTAPSGRTWTGLPTQPAAFALAQSLAAIDTMLATTNQPRLAAVPDTAPWRPEYGCYRVPAKAR